MTTTLAPVRTMASSIKISTLQSFLVKSHFLGQTHVPNRPQKPYLVISKQPSTILKPCTKFDLFETMGGRGLCNGEKGIELELKRNVAEQESEVSDRELENSKSVISVLENAFEKEMMGLAGGFPGGEKGLRQFIEKNPPPKKPVVADSVDLEKAKPA